ncbi:MAG TPA: nickel pincer cofactor biosynthesis protein LarC [Pyrinomonadaceae bacterium]|nr:nickel pincer cofactor biosynthesis protein LarC [Pyrinomonadaceae bacterium]
MRTLYFDCFAGASGNMILGGLVALGVDQDELRRRLQALSPVGFELTFTKVNRSGIDSVHADVSVPDERSHRHLSHIEKIIDEANLSARVKDRSKAIFRRLAQAEAKVHGTDVDRVHFHEVGAMDAIVDIVGACVGFEMLGIEHFACSKIHVGSGFINIAHGRFPVPPPAVTELLSGFSFYSTEIEGELATPTGVAIVTTVCEPNSGSPELTVDKVGYGAGTRDYDGFPNAIRLVVGETASESRKQERLVQLETNIDDMSPQVLGHVMERAFSLGALDCWFTPIQMKKDRPAVMLSVLCEREKRDALARLIYSETSTIGIRFREVERECLAREIVRVETAFGAIDVKVAMLDGKVMNAMPEYDHVRALAVDSGVPFREIHDAALAALKEKRTLSAAS